MAMLKAFVVVLGGINMDLIFETERIPGSGESISGTSLSKFSGGKGANTAVAAYRASHDRPRNDHNAVASTAVICNEVLSENGGVANSNRALLEVHVFLNGAVGKDEFGPVLLDRLVRKGVDVSQVQVLDGEETGTAVVMVEAWSGESRCLAYLGANKKWESKHIKSVNSMAGGSKPDIVICHLSNSLDEVTRVLVKAREEKLDTLLNPSPAAHLEASIYRSVTHLILNEQEAAVLSKSAEHGRTRSASYGKTAEYFLRLGVQNVVITLGAKGAYYSTEGGDSGLVEAEKDINVADTTGAGYVYLGR